MKRILSLFVILMLCISFFPASASAVNTRFYVFDGKEVAPLEAMNIIAALEQADDNMLIVNGGKHRIITDVEIKGRLVLNNAAVTFAKGTQQMPELPILMGVSQAEYAYGSCVYSLDDKLFPIFGDFQYCGVQIGKGGAYYELSNNTPPAIDLSNTTDTIERLKTISRPPSYDVIVKGNVTVKDFFNIAMQDNRTFQVTRGAYFKIKNFAKITFEDSMVINYGVIDADSVLQFLPPTKAGAKCGLDNYGDMLSTSILNEASCVIRNKGKMSSYVMNAGEFINYGKLDCVITGNPVKQKDEIGMCMVTIVNKDPRLSYEMLYYTSFRKGARLVDYPGLAFETVGVYKDADHNEVYDVYEKIQKDTKLYMELMTMIMD